MEELKIVKEQEKYIASYNKAVAGCVKSAWGLAEVVYKTVNAKDFGEVFENVDGYAKHLNVAKSTISKLVKSYERKLLIDAQETDAEKDFSVGQLEEFGKVPVSETLIFIEEQEVTTKDTTKEIREKVKNYFESDEQEETEETDAQEEETDAQEEEDDSMIVSYKGTEIQITNDEIIKAIMNLLKGE